MSRLTQILRGKKIKPLTEIESAVKYAIDNAGSGGGSSLPAVTSADNGDLLGVVEGAWGKVDPPAELPAVSSTDNGSLLGVSDGAWAKVAAPTELPAVTGADNGSLLGVSEGAWAKVAPWTNIYATTATVSQNGQGKTVYTFPETCSSFYNALASGKKLHFTAALGENRIMEVYTDVFCVEYDLDGDVGYAFRFVDEDNTAYSMANADPVDTVVLTEE